MIRITDRTLSCLDDYDAAPRLLRSLCKLLLKLGTDFTEISVDAYRKMGHLPENGKYILKVENVLEARKYPGFDRYICRHSGLVTPVEVVTEIQVNDLNEIHLLKQYQNLASVRITGLDDILCHDYQTAFQQIKKNVPGKTEICPQNHYFCATAIAVEWILSGGKNIAASFAGIGNFAPLEEVLMALRLELRYKPNMDYSVYPQIKAIFEQITGEKIPAHKSIIGSNIFDVEAGVHADGILKDPNIYEPFKPELVGDRRCLVLGKHSGKAAVLMKLKELGMEEAESDISAILDAVRQKSIEKQCSLTDEDFIALIKAI